MNWAWGQLQNIVIAAWKRLGLPVQYLLGVALADLAAR